MHYKITYLVSKNRSTVFLDASDAATAVSIARNATGIAASSFELLSVLPKPALTPKIPQVLASSFPVRTA